MFRSAVCQARLWPTVRRIRAWSVAARRDDRVTCPAMRVVQVAGTDRPASACSVRRSAGPGRGGSGPPVGDGRAGDRGFEIPSLPNKAFLKSGVMTAIGGQEDTTTGALQSGMISPVRCVVFRFSPVYRGMVGQRPERGLRPGLHRPGPPRLASHLPVGQTLAPEQVEGWVAPRYFDRSRQDR